MLMVLAAARASEIASDVAGAATVLAEKKQEKRGISSLGYGTPGLGYNSLSLGYGGYNNGNNQRKPKINRV